MIFIEQSRYCVRKKISTKTKQTNNNNNKKLYASAWFTWNLINNCNVYDEAIV